MVKLNTGAATRLRAKVILPSLLCLSLCGCAVTHPNPCYQQVREHDLPPYPAQGTETDKRAWVFQAIAAYNIQVELRKQTAACLSMQSK